MDCMTHLIIALKVKKALKKDLKIKINTLSFLFGNIKPDFSPKYAKIEHYKRNSNDFLQNEICQILNWNIYKKKTCPGTFSESLGIITHYLSDFFCYVHSDHFKGSMREHYLYEFRLLLKYLSNHKNIDDYSIDIPVEISINKASIFEYIEALNNKYLTVCNAASPEIDMIYTLHVSKYLCLSVIASCLSQGEKLSNTHLLPA